jgi:hypothetical protein
LGTFETYELENEERVRRYLTLYATTNENFSRQEVYEVDFDEDVSYWGRISRLVRPGSNSFIYSREVESKYTVSSNERWSSVAEFQIKSGSMLTGRITIADDKDTFYTNNGPVGLGGLTFDRVRDTSKMSNDTGTGGMSTSALCTSYTNADIFQSNSPCTFDGGSISGRSQIPNPNTPGNLRIENPSFELRSGTSVFEIP